MGWLGKSRPHFRDKGQKHPRWSPDGKWIAFLSGREDDNENDQLWILPIGAAKRKKLPTQKGAWTISPGLRIRNGSRSWFTIPIRASPEEKKRKRRPCRRLVIDRFFFKKDVEGYLTERYSHLQLLDLATPQNRAAHFRQTRRSLARLVAGRQRDRVCYQTGRRPRSHGELGCLGIGAAPGGKERQLTTSPEADPHPDWDSAPAWSPDGKSIAYIHGGDPKKIAYAVHSLAIIPAAGGAAKILTEKLDRNVFQPHWAPDGKSIFAMIEDDGAKTSPASHRWRRAAACHERAEEGHRLRCEPRWKDHCARQLARSARMKFSQSRKRIFVT